MGSVLGKELRPLWQLVLYPLAEDVWEAILLLTTRHAFHLSLEPNPTLDRVTRGYRSILSLVVAPFYVVHRHQATSQKGCSERLQHPRPTQRQQ